MYENIKILKFSMKNCQPCKRYAHIFNEFIEETGIKSSNVDIDEQHELASKYNVMSVPTTVFIKNGEVVSTQTGAMSKPALRKMVESFA